MVIRPYDDMTYNPDTHRRRSIRLPGYDYARPGAYFVTLCTAGHRCLFGSIVGDVMELNDAGRVAAACWRGIPAHFAQVALDEFIIMPNHVHGIIWITDPVGANDDSPVPNGANDDSPLPRRPHGTSNTVGSIIRGFKIGVTKWLRQNAGVRDPWQRNYFEHVIRNDTALGRIRQYILSNPPRWPHDRLNPWATSPEPEDAWRPDQNSP